MQIFIRSQAIRLENNVVLLCQWLDKLLTICGQAQKDRKVDYRCLEELTRT